MLWRDLFITTNEHKDDLSCNRSSQDDTSCLHTGKDKHDQGTEVLFFCFFKESDPLRAQELCESRGGRPGLPSLINLRFLWA